MVPDDRHFMDYPEVERYFETYMPCIINESDRGAVLLCVSVVDEQLKEFFGHLMPSYIGENKKKEILGLAGPFSTFSGKLNIALTCRLLPKSVVESAHALRRLRNKVAHDPIEFKLDDYSEQVGQIFSLLGPGVYSSVSQSTVQFMLKNTLENLLKLQRSGPESRKIFSDEVEALRYMLDNPDQLEKLKPAQLRWELGMGISLLCGLIADYRARLINQLSEGATLIDSI